MFPSFSASQGNPGNRRIRPRRKSPPLPCGVAPAVGLSTVTGNAKACAETLMRDWHQCIFFSLEFVSKLGRRSQVFWRRKAEQGEVQKAGAPVQAKFAEVGWLTSHTSFMPGGRSLGAMVPRWDRV